MVTETWNLLFGDVWVGGGGGGGDRGGDRGVLLNKNQTHI